jgi:hypothetical protein
MENHREHATILSAGPKPGPEGPPMVYQRRLTGSRFAPGY